MYLLMSLSLFRSAASMQLILSDSSFALSVTVVSFKQALVFTPIEGHTTYISCWCSSLLKE